MSADRLYGGAPGTEYASDYASGSFAEYIDELAGDTGIPDFQPGSFPPAPPPGEPSRTPGNGFPAMLSAPPPAPVEAPPPPSRCYSGSPGWPDDTGQPDDIVEDDQSAGRGWYDDGPATKPGPVLTGGALEELRYRRPSRTRMLAGVAAVVILGIAGVTGTLAVIHSRSGSPQGGAGQASSASPSPAETGAATQNVAQWTTPVAIDPQTLASSTTITGLSCTLRGGCYAADSRGMVLALHSSGDWPVAATDPNGGLVALSCSAAGSCLTIDSQGLSMVLRHGTWSSPVSIGTGSGTVTSASCASPDFCLAVDTIGQAFTYASPPALVTADHRAQRPGAERGVLRQPHRLRGGRRGRRRVQLRRRLMGRAGHGGQRS